ncbi:Receptor-type guanylate cyclase gcy [Seminavis robusta]|uniref:Phosphodiesterase n=1 Tax=Seminavis robusta TaxID=568900 RepID=A0A9N8D4W8_9STRA|nr:Receptor-type guanylate cyclase gcy [Seminavis robusta]|eukprot:Sro2_g001110.1 Receptor-type guanylate cyclase gcy (1172) ;mRNA; r:16607-22148
MKILSRSSAPRRSSTANWLEPTSFRPEDLLDELQDEEETNTNGDEFSNGKSGNGTTGQSKDDSLTDSETIKEHSMNIEKTTKRTLLAALLVLIVGSVASCSFLYMGISNTKQDNSGEFERRASDLAKSIDSSWKDYDAAALWVHQACRNWRTDNFTSEDFEILYHYTTSGGLDFEMVQWNPNITHQERPQMERQGLDIWGPYAGYQGGITGLEPDPANPEELVFKNRSEQPFYFPIQFGEPKELVGKAGNYDVYSAPWEAVTIDKALQTGEPALTGRFMLVGTASENAGYSVALYHPGAPLPDKFNSKPRDLTSLVVSIGALLKRAARDQAVTLSVYLFDKTNNKLDPYVAPQFLSGVEIRVLHETVHHDQQTNQTTTTTTITNPQAETSYDALHKDTDLYYEREMEIGGRVWTVVVVPVQGTYVADLASVVVSGVMIFVASALLAVWMIHNMYQSIAMHRVITKAAAEASIVSNLFPPAVRERMIQDAQIKARRLKDLKSANKQKQKDVFVNGETGERSVLSKSRLNTLLTSEGIFGSKPIAELHPYTTLMFADLVGFTAWSSVREPSQVFTLLEILYHSFDMIAQRRRVYKVETVGDCYVAVCGLPKPRKDHAAVMARFANDCLNRLLKLVKALEKSLGPDTSNLGLRIGLHSGQVVAGVLRGDKGRFQLFGDAINTASRMESTGVCNRIQASSETAELLIQGGRQNWLIPRDDLVEAKGKGKLQTYFIRINEASKASDVSDDGDVLSSSFIGAAPDANLEKINRLVEWNVQVLSALLKSVVARREAMGKGSSSSNSLINTATGTGTGMVLEEVKEVITLPEFCADTLKKQVDPESVELDVEVVDQLRHLITRIASGYHFNPFHNFEHASHVTMSVIKMMSRIVDPKQQLAVKRRKGDYDKDKLDAELHDHTFGITSDPLTRFACTFSALIHDLDHLGIPNMVLIKEESPLAEKYNNLSVAEQNSVDLAWSMLMEPRYENLRSCLCCDAEEFTRFRSLVVNSVMATDIMDKNLGAARKQRWNIAFNPDNSNGSPCPDDTCAVNRKATIVIEHLIQASDVSHTMQHWHVYAKWNERLFHEMYKGYKAGRLEKDPSEGWYQGELGFFDFYVIPLAKKLFTCGVFGVSSDEFLNYAEINRKEWERKGQEMVQQYLINYKEKYESPDSGAVVP